MTIRMNAKYFSYEEQIHLLSHLVSLAERGGEFSHHLESMGFKAFKAWQTFEASFCGSQNMKLHESYLVEEAKLFIATPDGVPGHLAGKERAYRSPIIESMRSDRDRENGCAYEQLGEHEWKSEIDPCRRCRAKLSVEGSSILEQREKKRSVDFSSYREEELRRCASVSRSYREENLAASLGKILELCLRDFGFKPDRLRSKAFFPVFSKPLNEFWDLCWSEDTDQNLKSPMQYQGPNKPRVRYLNLNLYIRAKGIGGNLEGALLFKKRDFVIIRYEKVVSGFEWAYSKYSNVSELEILVRARVALYSLMSAFLEATLAQVFIS